MTGTTKKRLTEGRKKCRYSGLLAEHEVKVPRKEMILRKGLTPHKDAVHG